MSGRLTIFKLTLPSKKKFHFQKMHGLLFFFRFVVCTGWSERVILDRRGYEVYMIGLMAVLFVFCGRSFERSVIDLKG